MSFFDTIPFLGYSFYQLCLLFLIWAFLGWGVEVCFHTIKMGEYSNRGFLDMPICPIYGFGVLIITIVLKSVSGDPLLVFLLSSLICTAFELAVGVAMRKIFHSIWWDYTDEHFNFHGYICLKVSIEWGIGGLIVISFVEPFTEMLINAMPIVLGCIIIAIFAVLIPIDTWGSVAAVKKLNVRLKEITEINAKMLETAQGIGEKLGGFALDTQDKGAEAYAGLYLAADEISDKAEELAEGIRSGISDKRAEMAEKMQNRYDALIAFSDRRVKRMIRAFPGMQSIDYEDAFLTIKSIVSGEEKKNAADKSLSR